jgi:hypothetical protein
VTFRGRGVGRALMRLVAYWGRPRCTRVAWSTRCTRPTRGPAGERGPQGIQGPPGATPTHIPVSAYHLMAGPAETFTILNVPDNKVFVLTDMLAMNLSGFNVIAHISDGTEEKMVLRFFVDAKNVFSLKLNSGIPFNPSTAVIVETEAGSNAEFLISGYLTTPENGLSWGQDSSDFAGYSSDGSGDFGPYMVFGGNCKISRIK